MFLAWKSLLGVSVVVVVVVVVGPKYQNREKCQRIISFVHLNIHIIHTSRYIRPNHLLIKSEIVLRIASFIPVCSPIPYVAIAAGRITPDRAGPLDSPAWTAVDRDENMPPSNWRSIRFAKPCRPKILKPVVFDRFF